MQYVARPTSRYQQFLNRIPVLGDVLRRPLGVLGFLIALGFFLMVVFAPLLAPYHYAEQDIPSMLQGPSRAHPLGTDHLGRDLWSRIVYGSRIALAVAVPAVAVAIALEHLAGQSPSIGRINPHQLAEPGRKNLFQEKQRTANSADRTILMLSEAHGQPP